MTVTRVLTRAGAQVGTEQFHVGYEPFAGTTCGSSTQSSNSGAASTQSGSAGATASPTAGSSHSGGGSSTGGDSPTPASSSASPSNSGVLGGLLH